MGTTELASVQPVGGRFAKEKIVPQPGCALTLHHPWPSAAEGQFQSSLRHSQRCCGGEFVLPWELDTSGEKKSCREMPVPCPFQANPHRSTADAHTQLPGRGHEAKTQKVAVPSVLLFSHLHILGGHQESGAGGNLHRALSNPNARHGLSTESRGMSRWAPATGWGAAQWAVQSQGGQRAVLALT